MTATTYRKRPVAIQAMRFDGTTESGEAIAAWSEGAAEAAFERLWINTLEGTMQAVEGDWIIRGVAGEFYPCKPEIFAATYEADPTHAEDPNALPERDPDLPTTDQGMFRKYVVRRVDGTDTAGGKHDGCELFVLDLSHDPHAPVALDAYADAVATTHPKLAAEMRERYGLLGDPAAQRAAMEGMADQVEAIVVANSELGTLVVELSGRLRTVYDAVLRARDGEADAEQVARMLVEIQAQAEAGLNTLRQSPIMRAPGAGS